MKVLLTGGSGLVGTFVTPYLEKEHTLRVLDPQPPKHPSVEYIQGSITNPDDLQRALDGVDTFINMVMKSPQGGSSNEQTLTQITVPQRPPRVLQGLKFVDLFLWLSQSQQRVSNSKVGDQTALPPADGWAVV